MDCEIANIERCHRKPVIGQQYSVYCQSLLPIGRSLHRSKHLLGIAPHKPACSTGRFGQAHSVKDGEACGFVLGAQACRLAQSGLSRIPNNREILRSEIRAGIRRFPHDPPVERCKSRLRDFAPFRLCRIEFRSIPELPGAQVLGHASNPLLDIFPAHAQGGAIASHAADHDMSVRVLGVVMLHRNPFEVGTEILLHTLHQIAR